MIQLKLHKKPHVTFFVGVLTALLLLIFCENFFAHSPTVESVYQSMKNAIQENVVTRLPADIHEFLEHSKPTLKPIFNKKYMLKNIDILKRVITSETEEIEKRLSGRLAKLPVSGREIPSKFLTFAQPITKQISRNVTIPVKVTLKQPTIRLRSTISQRKAKKPIRTTISIPLQMNKSSPSHLYLSGIRKNYLYNKPSVGDLMKLSGYLLDVESATDPQRLSATCKDEVYLLILVTSQPESFERRTFIRYSWANMYEKIFHKVKQFKKFQTGKKYSSKNVVKVVFIIGHTNGRKKVMKKVYKEQSIRKDLVIGSLIEDYRNLTLKTRLALKWSYYDCKSVYTIKTDDDVFINTVVLVEWLKQQSMKRFYTGWCNFNSPVIRNNASKWYVSREDYAEDHYPGYCLGGGYLMSNDVVGSVLKKSYGRKMFPMEDLYVGLMIAEMNNIKVQDQRKHFDMIYYGRQDDCELNKLFLAHRVLKKDLINHAKRAEKALSTCNNTVIDQKHAKFLV